jgi:hypothetical protein
MLKNPKPQMALVLSVALLTGYAAASGMLNPFQRADARPPQQSSASGGPAGAPVSGLSRSGLAAQWPWT